MHNFIRVLLAAFFVLIMNAPICMAEEIDLSALLGYSEFLSQEYVSVKQGYSELPSQKYVSVKEEKMDIDHAKNMVNLPAWCGNVISYTMNYTIKDERKKIARDKNVRRSGKLLTIKPVSAPPIIFKNWSDLGNDQHEGDGESFLYMGKIPHNGFYRVDAYYTVGWPDSYFINPRNGQILYADISTDTVSFSPDGKRILVMRDSLNHPFGFLVANISNDTTTIELFCRCQNNPNIRNVIHSGLNGWHDPEYVGFDLLITVQQDSSNKLSPFILIPVRLSLQGDGWHLAAPDPLELKQATGLECSQIQNISK